MFVCPPLFGQSEQLYACSGMQWILKQKGVDNRIMQKLKVSLEMSKIPNIYKNSRSGDFFFFFK